MAEGRPGPRSVWLQTCILHYNIFFFPFFLYLPVCWVRLNGPTKVAAKVTQIKTFSSSTIILLQAPHEAPSLKPICSPPPGSTLWAPHTGTGMIHSTKIGPWEGKRAHKTLQQFYDIFLAFTGGLGGQGRRTASVLGRWVDPMSPALVRTAASFLWRQHHLLVPKWGRAI